ncbi:MAG: hypothetical protein SFY69_03115 [Planctomycetota bacterium]|nr:hypothetical protein [Planctomycetota bacterium]
MRTSRALTLAAVCGLVPALSLPALAQRAPGTPATPGAGALPAADPERLYTVNFPGGAVADYVELLRQSKPGRGTNIVVSMEAARVRLAPISLRDVSLGSAVYAMHSAAGTADGELRIRLLDDGGDELYGVDYSVPIRTGGLGQPPANSRNAPDLRMEVLSLRPVTDGAGALRVEAALTGVQTALDLAPGEPAEMKFHAETGLLIIRGTPEQLHAAQECVGRMREDMERRRAEARAQEHPEAQLIERRAMLQKAELETHKATERVRLLRAMHDRLEQKWAAGAVDEPAVQEVRSKLLEAELGAQAAEIEQMQAAELFALMQRERTEGPGVVTIAMPGWEAKPAEELASVLTSAGRAMGATVAPAGGGGLRIEGAGSTVQMLVSIAEEVARARGLAKPDVRPAPTGGR